MRIPVAEKPCEECNCKAKHHAAWAVMHGHLLCGKCKRRTSFPNILGHHNGNTIVHDGEVKQKFTPTGILSQEARFLYNKHLKASGNDTEAREAVHQARLWTKQAHYSHRERHSGNGSKFKVPDDKNST